MQTPVLTASGDTHVYTIAYMQHYELIVKHDYSVIAAGDERTEFCVSCFIVCACAYRFRKRTHIFRK